MNNIGNSSSLKKSLILILVLVIIPLLYFKISENAEKQKNIILTLNETYKVLKSNKCQEEIYYEISDTNVVTSLENDELLALTSGNTRVALRNTIDDEICDMYEITVIAKDDPTDEPDDPNDPTDEPDDPNDPTDEPDDPSDPTDEPDDPNNQPSGKLVLQDTKIEIKTGDTYKLKYTLNSDNGLIWKSSNNEIAIVQDGVVTAIKAGTAKITITTNNNVEAACEVIVADSEIQISKISLNRSNITLSVGDSETLTIKTVPNEINANDLIWQSEDKSVATVSNGLITAHKKGTTIIKVQSNNGKIATCKVTVKERNVSSPIVTISSTNQSNIKSLKVKIDIKNNSGLSSNNIYKYCLSTSSTDANICEWKEYKIGKEFTIGEGVTGVRYLWIYSISDAEGNKENTKEKYILGTYSFDNTSPTVKYNIEGGIYNSVKTIVITPKDETEIEYYDIQVYKNDNLVTDKKNLKDKNYVITLDSEGIWKVHTKVVDRAGNLIIQQPLTSTNSYVATYVIDLTKPVIKYNLASGIYDVGKMITITSNDTGGSGFSYMNVHVYKNNEIISTKSKQNITSNSFTVNLDSEGYWIIYAQSFDKAKNSINQQPMTQQWYYQRYGINKKEIFSDAALSLQVGVASKFNVSFISNDPNNKIPKWTSSNPQVATVDSNGNIKGITQGYTLITSTLGNASKKIYVGVGIINKLEIPQITLYVRSGYKSYGIANNNVNWKKNGGKIISTINISDLGKKFLETYLTQKIETAGGVGTRGGENYSNPKGRNEGTRAGAVAAARFLALEFPFSIPYANTDFYNRANTSYANTVYWTDLGTYYNASAFLGKKKSAPGVNSFVNNDSEFKVEYLYGYKLNIYNTHNGYGNGCWGCSTGVEDYTYNWPGTGKDVPAYVKYHGLHCATYVMWSLYNGGLNVLLDMQTRNIRELMSAGTGYLSSKIVSSDNYLSFKNMTTSNWVRVKVGDLIILQGHIGILIGIDRVSGYMYVAHQTGGGIHVDRLNYGRAQDAGDDMANRWEQIILMDSIYEKDGNLTDVWWET